MHTASEVAATHDSEVGLARGAAIGRYIVLEMVGKGGMGEVYAAYDPELDRKIAIKLLRQRLEPARNGEDAQTRLMREAQAIAKLSHPNVIVVYDVGTFAGRVFIAMEFVDGHTVSYWMHAEPRSWADTLKVFIAAGHGLAAAHEKQMIHRDFKPDNVMVRNDGQVRVMDFGLARLSGSEKTPEGALAPPPGHPHRVAPPAASDLVDQDLESTRELRTSATQLPQRPDTTTPLAANLTRTGSMLGTPAYMAPEQFLGRAIDARTDQFSFCVALYEALFERRPFAGDTLFGLTANVVQGVLTPRPSQTLVPDWLEKALLRGLSVAPDDRWPSMDALLTELERNRVAPEQRGFRETAASKLAGTWEAPVGGRRIETAGKEQMRRAFLATGKSYAATSFQNVSQVLDQYAQSWTEMYVDACEATHVRKEQSAEILDLRIGFLQQALESLRALCQIFREASGDVVENALGASSALPRIERAADIEVLRAVLKPPADPEARAAVDDLRTRLAQVRTLSNVGRLTDASQGVATLEPAVRHHGYGPLLAELLLLKGSILMERGEFTAATESLAASVWTAELSRHDEVVAEAATQLVGAGTFIMHHDVVEVWAQHAEMTLRRMGGHEALWSWFFNNRACNHRKDGDLKRAMEDVRRAIALKEKTFGPNHPDTAISIATLANILADRCELEEAINEGQRSLRIIEEREGPDHPRSSLFRYNYSDYLNLAGRFTEASVAAKQALTYFERESDPSGLIVSAILLSLGTSYLGSGMADQALSILERAVKGLESNAEDPARLGEAHFALARALSANARDLPRARALAKRARTEYARSSTSVRNTRALAQIDAFLAEGERSV
ncbi:MAG TPA: serine/threonine-protein kinase [Polyangia bacterium]|nr:serine/threonine-protein kinase [Polyangia bacterium]